MILYTQSMVLYVHPKKKGRGEKGKSTEREQKEELKGKNWRYYRLESRIPGTWYEIHTGKNPNSWQAAGVAGVQKGLCGVCG